MPKNPALNISTAMNMDFGYYSLIKEQKLHFNLQEKWPNFMKMSIFNLQH